MKIKQLLFAIGCAMLLTILFGACTSDSEKNTSPTGTQPSAFPEIDKLSAKIAENPDDAALYAARAAVYYEYEGYDEAINDLQKAIALDSLNVEYRHELANFYMDYNNSLQALRTMEQTADLFPKRIPTLLKLSEFQLIFKKYREALLTLERIRIIDPLNAEMFYMAGLVFLETDRKEEAISNFQSAVENDPDIVEAWVYLGQLWAEKNPGTAIHFFDNALRIDSTDLMALYAKAEFLATTMNDLEGAIKTCDQIIRHDVQAVEAYINSGLFYLELDAVKEAYQRFNMAAQVDPTSIRAYYYRGLAAEMQGNRAGALSDYEQVLKLSPEDPDAQAGIERLQNPN